MKRLLPLFAAITLLGQQPRYTFRRIADNAPGSPFRGGTVSPFGRTGALNASGAAAFTVTLASGVQTVYFSTPEGALTRVIEDRTDDLPEAVGLNDAGTVLVNTARGIFTWAGGQLFKVYESGQGELTYRPGAPPSISNDGTVAFSTGTRILGRTGDGAVRELVGTTEVPRVNAFSTAFLNGAAINKAGEVAFAVSGIAECTGCVYKKSNGQLVRIGQGSDSVAPALNDDGDAGFILRPGGIYLGRGGTPRLAVDLSERKLSPLGVLNLNRSGQVAFLAAGAIAGIPTRGIYTGADPVKDKVITINDPLFGSTVTALEQSGGFLDGRRLNDKGEVLFSYTLSNGISGIAVATPTAATAAGAPQIAANGIVNAAAFTSAVTVPVAPGAIVSIFGSNLASQLTVANGAPLPAQLGGTRVTVNGAPAPLYFVAPTQINLQIPYGIPAGTATIQISTAAGVSESQTVAIRPQTPAVYSMAQSGRGQAVAVFANSATLVGPARLTADSRPARAGDVITIYANSLGAVTPPVQAGWNSCAESNCAPDLSNLTLRYTELLPQIWIGGVPVAREQILFSGLAPQFPGLYQINLLVPTGILRGSDVPLLVLAAGAARTDSTSPVTIAID